MRIAIAGIHIEASTFTLHRAGADDFQQTRGQDLVDSFPFADWLGEETAAGIEWIPTLHAVTGASGPMLPEVYDAFEAEILETLAANGPYDGVYLPLHGAMNVLGRTRAEERFVRSIREVVGPDAVLSASMDPHGNFSEELAELLDLASSHRHAPHIDNAQTRERAVVNLVETIRRGEKPLKAWVRIPVLLPGERTSTVVEPGKSVFGALLPVIEEHGVVDANLWIGFAWADEERNAAASFVTGYDRDAVLAAAEELAQIYWDAREDFVIVMDHFGSYDQALDFIVGGAPTPVFVSDSGDNVTAGGSGDVTFAIEATLARPDVLDGRRFLFAGLVDAATLDAAIAAGVGATLERSIGAVSDARYAAPVAGSWLVEELISDRAGDRITGALLSDGPVSVTVQWARDAFISPDDPSFPPGVNSGLAFTDVSSFDAVVVKNGYQFPSQVALAGSSFMALTPGGTDLDFDRLEFVDAGRPIFPLDRRFDADLTPAIVPASGARS